MEEQTSEPRRYTFTAPSYPWKGVAGTVLMHAGWDPERARHWLSLPLDKRALATVRYFADPDAPEPSLSHWAKFVQIWASQEPGSKPYVTLPPAATIIAKTLHSNPGTMWQRILESYHWNSETLDDARLLVKRVAEGTRDLPFSTFYEWARIAKWVDQHPQESEDLTLPATWTDKLARQCLNDSDFWDAYATHDDELVALEQWLTTSPTTSSPDLDSLLANYTHWLSVEARDSTSSTPGPVMVDDEWPAFAKAWSAKNGGQAASGQELHWLIRERGIVPSTSVAGDDPLTARQRIMDWLEQAERLGLLACEERAATPWESRYAMVPGAAQAMPAPSSTTRESLPPSNPDEWSRLDWARFAEAWTSELGSEAVPLDRILKIITKDPSLRRVLPKMHTQQMRYLRELLSQPLPAEVGVSIEHSYNPRKKRTVFELRFASPDSVDPGPAQSPTTASGTSESTKIPTSTPDADQFSFSDAQIQKFLAGWERAFGNKSVILRDLENAGAEQGWALPLPPLKSVTQKHPLSLWLIQAATHPHGEYIVERISSNRRTTYRLTRQPSRSSSQDSFAEPQFDEPKVGEPEPTPASVTQISALVAMAEKIERLLPDDLLSTYVGALAPWIPALKASGTDASWFLEYGLNPLVYKKIVHLWPTVNALLDSHPSS